MNRLPFGYVQSVHSGDLVSRASGDVGQATQVIGNNTYSLISNTATCLLAFSYLSRIDLPLALLVVGGGPIIFGAGRFFDRKIRRLSKDIQDQSATLRGTLQEMFQGMPVIKAFGLERSFANKYNTERAAAMDMMKRRSLLNAAMWRTVNITNDIFLVGCVSLIALAAIRGSLTVGAVLAFTILMGRVQWPFVGLSTTWGSVQQGLGAADRMFAVMDVATEDRRPRRVAAAQSAPLSYVSRIRARRKRRLALLLVRRQPAAGLNLQVKPGEIVALVGPSGRRQDSGSDLLGSRDVTKATSRCLDPLKSDLNRQVSDCVRSADTVSVCRHDSREHSLRPR